MNRVDGYEQGLSGTLRSGNNSCHNSGVRNKIYLASIEQVCSRICQKPLTGSFSLSVGCRTWNLETAVKSTAPCSRAREITSERASRMKFSLSKAVDFLDTIETDL